MEFDFMNAFLCSFDLVLSEGHEEVVAKGAQWQIVAL